MLPTSQMWTMFQFPLNLYHLSMLLAINLHYESICIIYNLLHAILVAMGLWGVRGHEMKISLAWNPWANPTSPPC